MHRRWRWWQSERPNPAHLARRSVATVMTRESWGTIQAEVAIEERYRHIERDWGYRNRRRERRRKEFWKIKTHWFKPGLAQRRQPIRARSLEWTPVRNNEAIGELWTTAEFSVSICNPLLGQIITFVRLVGIISLFSFWEWKRRDGCVWMLLRNRWQNVCCWRKNWWKGDWFPGC